MAVYLFSELAYAKMILHAAKYPHLAVNGVLLANKIGGEILDIIPLFHQCLFITPMVEIALMQIDAYAEKNNLLVAGYYCAAENFHDNSIDKAPAAKIADRIQENYKNACFVLIDNKLMTLGQEIPAIKVFRCTGDSVRWSKTDFHLCESETTLQAVSTLLKRGVMNDVVDFDNHLDNPEKDWTNKSLNQTVNYSLEVIRL